VKSRFLTQRTLDTEKAQMAMMRVMQATRMEREGRWPSEGFTRMGRETFD